VRKLICVIILISLFGFNTNKNTDIVLKKGKTIIEGKVNNFSASIRVLRFAAEGIVEDIEQTAILDSLGNFRVEIDLFNAQNVNLIYEDRLAALYLEPGDSLFLDLDADLFKKGIYPYYEVSGNNSNTSKNIRDYFQFHNPYTYEPIYNKSIKEFLNGLKNQIDIEDSVLDKFSIKENPTSKFKSWAKSFIKYNMANHLLGYFAYYDMNYKQYKTEIFDTDLFPVDKDSAIVSPLYITHLSNYAAAKYVMSDSVFTKLIKKKELSNAYSRVFNNLIKNEKPGLSMDIMIYKIFNGFYEHRSPEISLSSMAAIWKGYKKYMNNPVLINTVDEEMSIAENQINKKDDSINSSLGSKFKSVENFVETLHSKHKDKIVYIDIWATWCGPCRAEIPSEIELQDYFRDKSVTFVNLCLASDRGEWEKVISKNHIKGDNYFFNEDETALFRSSLKFPGYPTYMIIDQRGKLIDKNAPRPSSGVEIKNVLNKLLKRH
jgi:thiol-disulfide isomerase/thioredoxin